MDCMRPASMLKACASAVVLVFASLSFAVVARAQTPPPVAPAKLVLLPYGEPGSTDPRAADISFTLAEDLKNAGMAVVRVPVVDHLEAVANAAKICADNGATGILIAEGRYEQTRIAESIPKYATVTRYPTRVEVRLDEIGCDGFLRWTTTTVSDEAPSDMPRIRNLGTVIDDGFARALHDAAVARASATVGRTPTGAVAASPAGAPATPPTYLLLPFEEPGIGDAHAAQITHSFLLRLQQRKLNVTVGTPMDHITAVAAAPSLCSASGAQAIIVPKVRLEQSVETARSHAAMRLSLLSCSGKTLARGVGDADVGHIYMFDAAFVAVSERAMGPALDQLFATQTGGGRVRRSRGRS